MKPAQQGHLEVTEKPVLWSLVAVCSQRGEEWANKGKAERISVSGRLAGTRWAGQGTILIDWLAFSFHQMCPFSFAGVWFSYLSVCSDGSVFCPDWPNINAKPWHIFNNAT